ncbi:MAG: hypothetical protein JRH18_21885 [Deltaproteobacteria bacterium]|nr:hypothetical protein [Deltaproteobacteria bacterium]MBW1963148.1 hypothetical protein [Deltaproteobacteria bacterium]MBW2154302.1 hypothetical protein [Deltaproteobacteria bacterium]
MSQDRFDIWILGAGKFGKQALGALRGAYPGAVFTIVDQNYTVLRDLNGPSVRTVLSEVISFLDKNLKSIEDANWIVPAVPVHVAYEWVCSQLERQYSIEPIKIPTPLFDVLPNPIPATKHGICISIADFLCPEGCPGPKDKCTVTGKPKPFLLHNHLSRIQYKGFRSIVVESRQLAAGAGGYEPKALFDALSEIKNCKKSILFSTASRCHGVMHAFRIIAPLL